MKLFLLTVVLSLVATIVFVCIVRRTLGRSAPLALVCAIVIAVFIAPITAVQFLGCLVLVAVLFLAITA